MGLSLVYLSEQCLIDVVEGSGKVVGARKPPAIDQGRQPRKGASTLSGLTRAPKPAKLSQIPIEAPRGPVANRGEFGFDLCADKKAYDHDQP